jgi:hypothetical protein
VLLLRTVLEGGEVEVEALVRLCKRTAAASAVGRGRIGEGMCKGVILVVQVDPIEPNVLTEPLFLCSANYAIFSLVSCCTCFRFFAGGGKVGKGWRMALVVHPPTPSRGSSR